MRYDEERGMLSIGVREFVTLARRGISESLPVFEDEPALEISDRAAYEAALAGTEERIAEVTFLLSDVPCTLSVKVRTREDGTAVFPVFVDGDPARPPKPLVSQIRGEAYVAAYALAEHEKRDTVRVLFSYRNPRRDAVMEVVETLSFAKTESFFNKCKASVALYAAPAVERVTERLPSMREAKFPYPAMREGQEALIRAVYRNIARGTDLISEAPTGTGKTVAALFPAIRAMGEEKCEKVFYLTAKGTAAATAEECVALLDSVGAKVRAVRVYAKDTVCEKDTVCKLDRKACPHLAHNTLPDAVRELWRRQAPVVGMPLLREVAARYGVCPYELSLAYAEIADVVICDVNYLFDPAVYLRRFFEEGGEYVFLVDEAHNVPDRVAAMVSDEITPEEILSIVPALPEHVPLVRAAQDAGERFSRILSSLIRGEERMGEDGNPFAFVHGKDLPAEIYTLTEELSGKVEDEIYRAYRAADGEREERLRALNGYYYRLRKFATALGNFDEKYEYFCKLEATKLSLKLFCVDPGSVIAGRVRRGRCAVWFSATLSPTSYFRDTLGADRTAECVRAPSPFDRAQVSVSIMDKIPTRFSQRGESLTEVMRVIACTVSAKRGHYIVYAPSFAYLSLLAKTFRAKYPKIRVLEQTRGQSAEERETFLSEFAKDDDRYLVAFCVMGGVFAEGIDLWGERLIGAVVVGVGFPAVCPEREAVAAYFDEKCDAGKQYAYIYPGMNKVLQAAGRVIRREDDRGVIVLIDDRFADPVYRKSIPDLWRGLKFVGDVKGLQMLLNRFWNEKTPDAR